MSRKLAIVKNLLSLRQRHKLHFLAAWSTTGTPAFLPKIFENYLRVKPSAKEGLGNFPTSKIPVRRGSVATGIYGSGYPLPMLAIPVFSSSALRYGS
ncbi:hypothetical protein HMPREF0240_02270 [Clostridium sp. D5]|nr:hypothetical protein HMPREF0240_02270 [Clostridium sp. D5]